MKLKSIALILMTVALPAMAEKVSVNTKGMSLILDVENGHLCTELFFLYYFRYTSKMYAEQEPLLRDLNQCCDYRKKIDFFIKCRGLHSYFVKKGGSLSVAIDNSNRSVSEKSEGNRDYTFSELGRMIEELRILRQ